jgi:hypothetical protein
MLSPSLSCASIAALKAGSTRMAGIVAVFIVSV